MKRDGSSRWRANARIEAVRDDCNGGMAGFGRVQVCLYKSLVSLMGFIAPSTAGGRALSGFLQGFCPRRLAALRGFSCDHRHLAPVIQPL